MKTKCLLFAFLLISAVNLNTLQAQEDDIYIPTESQSADDEIFVPSDTPASTNEEVIIDESDSNDVQGAGEYDY